MKRKGNKLYDIICQFTGEQLTYQKVELNSVGEAISDLDCDGVVYRKLNDEYYKLNFEYISPERYGAKGDGITDDTIPFQKALNSGFKVLANNKYFCDKLTVPSGTELFLNGEIIKRTYNNNLSFVDSILELQENSYLHGKGIVNGNSTNLLSDRTQTFALNDCIRVLGNDVVVKTITIKDTFNETFYGKEIKNCTIENVKEIGVGRGATWLSCEDIKYKSFLQTDSDFKFENIYQHCLDFIYCTGTQIDGATFRNVNSTGNAPSYAISGITLMGCTKGNYNNLSFRNNLSPTKEGLPIADDGSTYSIFNNVIIEKFKCGTGFEIQGGKHNIYSNFIIDSTDLSNTISGSVGMHLLDTAITGGILNGAYSQQSRDRALACNNTIKNVKIYGGYNGFRLAGQNNVFEQCYAIGQTFGWRIQPLQGGVDTAYWAKSTEQNISNNKLINCGAINCNEDGIGYWGGDNLQIVNFESRNNKNAISNKKRLQLIVSSATANTISTQQSLQEDAWKNFYIYVSYTASNQGFGQYIKILSNSTSTFQLEQNFDVIPQNGDEFVVIDKQGTININGGIYTDDQNFTLNKVGSFKYEGNISGFTEITITQGAERFEYNQNILIKNIVTGASSPDLICKVNSINNESTDVLKVTPFSLGDGNPLTGNIVLPVQNGIGTVSISDYAIGEGQYYSKITGITADLTNQVDGHFFVKIGNDIAQVVKKLQEIENSYLLNAKLPVNTETAFTIIKADVAGVPSMQNGLNFNRHYGKVILDNNVKIENATQGLINNYRSYQVAVGILKVINSIAEINDFSDYKTNNTVATTISDFSPKIVNKKVVIVVNDDNTTLDFTTGLKGYLEAKKLKIGDIVFATWSGSKWICDIKTVDGINTKNVFGDYSSTSPSLKLRGGKSGSGLLEFDRTDGVTQNYRITLPAGFCLYDQTNGNASFFTSAFGSTNKIVAGQPNRVTTSPRIGIFSAEDISAASGASVAGADAYWESGAGVGSGSQSSHYFRTPDGTGSGSQQTKSSKMRLSGDGNIILGNNLATNPLCAIFSMNSTTRGFLPSRMTKANRLAILLPQEGLIVRQIQETGIEAEAGLYEYKLTGGWTKIS